MNEFELIARYFTRPTVERQGIGDDCALIDVGDRTLAVTADLLVEHVHFFPDVEPAALGHKALAVNLSDLAAAGAQPRCFLLSLSLPAAEPAWLEAFSGALHALAGRHGCALVGGDTARSPRVGMLPGPVTVAITAIGEVDRRFVRGRAGAGVDDDIWVSGQLGDAALSVAHHRGQAGLSGPDALECRRRLDWPLPRVDLGLALRGLATAAVDVSDGLLADLGHILSRSGVGAEVQGPEVPRSDLMRRIEPGLQRRCVLAGGDDYELVFTAPPARRAGVEAAAVACCIAVSRIGKVIPGQGIRLVGEPGFDATLPGYDHFAEAPDPRRA